MTNLVDLYFDTLSEIFKHIDAIDLVNLQLTCKHMYKNIWQYLDLKFSKITTITYRDDWKEIPENPHILLYLSKMTLSRPVPKYQNYHPNEKSYIGEINNRTLVLYVFAVLSKRNSKRGIYMFDETKCRENLGHIVEDVTLHLEGNPSKICGGCGYGNTGKYPPIEYGCLCRNIKYHNQPPTRLTIMLTFAIIKILNYTPPQSFLDAFNKYKSSK